MKWPLTIAAIIALLFGFLQCSGAAGKTCAALKGTALEGCSSAGYNHSFPLPSRLSKRTRTWVRSIVNYVTTRMKNCSVASVSETVACAVLAPNCVEGNSKPFLPCRRVCSEFLKRCSSQMPDYFVDVMIGMCSLLPNSTANTGQCYEPPKFDFHHNDSLLGPLERGCQKLVFPFCQDLHYTHTIVTEERQKRLFRVFYGKNYSTTDHTPAPFSRLRKFQTQLANATKCATNLKKLFCAELLPPCFAEKKPSFYTACKSVCKSVAKECPQVVSKPGTYGFLMYCERLANGNSTMDHGYCRHTSWPPPLNWANFDAVPTAPPSTPKGYPTAVIIISIIVPVVVVGLIILAAFFYKRRKLTSLGYSKQEDDRADLVT